MTYTKQTWADSNPSYPVSAARLSHMEDGIEAVEARIPQTKEVWTNDPQYGTPGTRAAFIAALDAAEALGKHTVVRIPNGLVIDVVTGLSLSGYSVQIKGSSAGVTSGGASACAIIASAQTGPVLDFTGYVSPYSFKGMVEPISNITIKGSGVADATKVNSGLKFKSLGSAYVHDVAIMNTGGPCIELAQNAGNAVYLSEFARIIMSTPVSANANDVPYFYANECNGTIFRGCGLRSTLGSADVGVSGAVVIESNASYPARFFVLDSWWFENLHVPNNGTLISLSTNGAVIRDTIFFDCLRDSGANATAFIRLLPTPIADAGGNTIHGFIPGFGTSTTVEIQTGIDIQQSYNSVYGVKGYRGNNVTLASGVNGTFVHLRGSYGTSTNAGWTNNSGTSTNHLIDDTLKTEVRPNGWIINGLTYTTGTGSPEGVVTGVIGDQFTQTDGAGGRFLFVKSSASGNTGWRQVVVEQASAATLAGVSQSLGFAASNCTTYTLTANQTFSSVTGARVGALFTVIIKQDATGSRTLTWPATIKWTTNTAPTLSTAANAQDVFVFICDSTGTLREVSRSLGQS